MLDPEISNYQSIPVRLYEFKLGSIVWRYAASEQAVMALGERYEPMAISDSGFKQSGDPQNDDFTISISASAPMTDLFIGTPPSEPMLVVLREKNVGSEAAPVIWTGTYRSSRRKKESVIYEVICRSVMSSLDRAGLRLSWGKGCPHALYDRLCRVNPNSFAVTAQISALNADGTISLTGLGSYSSGWFAGGYIECVIRAGTVERRGIERHTGANIYLLSARDGLEVGMWVTAYPGCDLTSPTCDTKFGNLVNYGGFPHIPNKSPFDGDPVF